MMGVFKMLMLYFILFTTINGFLLESQQSNRGQSLPSNQYMTLSKFYEEEKGLQQKMENLQQDNSLLRHDVDNSFVLLTTQLQHKLDLLDTKLAVIEKNNATNQDILELVEKNKALEQSFNDLKNENAMLQTKYNEMENEFQLYKNNTKQLDELQTGLYNDIRTNCSILGTESAVLRNKSILVDQEISNLKQLGSIQPLQEIKTLHQTVQTISAQTNSLNTCMKERARSQDFLALYNMTTHSLHELEVRTQSIGTQLSKIQNDFTMKFHETENRDNLTIANLHNIERRSKAIENRNNLTLSRIQQQLNDSTEQVALTAHLTSSTSTNGILKFDDVKFSIGINDISAYKSTGKFVCGRKGLYIISASIMSFSNSGDYYIYLNGIRISQTKAGYFSNPSSYMYQTGTVVLTQQLLPNDSVWVHNLGSNMIGGLWATLTVVKVK